MKNNFIKEKLNELISQGVIIDLSQKTIEKKLDNFSYDFVVEMYKEEFIFQFDKSRCHDDTYLSSFFNLFDFDTYLSKKLLSRILWVEKRLKAAVWDNVRDFLIEEMKKTSDQKFSYKKWNANDLETNEENKKAFIRLCKQHCSSEKKKINKFIRFIFNNKEQLLTKSVAELLEEYCLTNIKPISSVKALKTEFKPLKDEIFKGDFLKINFVELTEQQIYDQVNKLFDDFIVRDMKKIMTKNISDSIWNNSCYSKKTMPISFIKNNWTFGTTIKVFESLNTDVKYKVINQFFKCNKNVKWNDVNKINTFIVIMRNFNIIRNRTAHHETIYNFDISKQSETSVIYEFISLNCRNIANKVSRNKINLFGILKCLDIFENRKVKQITQIASSLFNKYIYCKTFPESFIFYLIFQLGINF